MFLRAFRRRVILPPDYPEELTHVLSRIEELTGWNLFERIPPKKNAVSYPLLDALNDLAKSVEFLVRRTVPRKITHYAFRDPLTRVFNRYFLQEQLHFLTRKKENFPVGVIYLDLDDLKYVNDRFGHRIGDLYIQRFASVLRSSIRKGDFVVRIGGDEFLIIIPRANEKIIEKVLRRIERNVRIVNGEFLLPVPLSYSAGWSIWASPEDPFEEALEKADKAMYSSKVGKKHLPADHRTKGSTT